MNTEPELELLISKRKLVSAVKKLAEEIRSDYIDKYPLLLGVLKGSFLFLADLIHNLNIPLEVDFIQLSSYKGGRESSGDITIVCGLLSRIEGRHVLVIEDIVDTGLTTAFLFNNLLQQKPASLKLCALLDKPSCHKISIVVDYLGFIMPDKFLVGYGMDWKEKYRNLPAIYYVK